MIKSYQCEICRKQFHDRKLHHQHIHSLNGCISQKQALDIYKNIYENKLDKSLDITTYERDYTCYLCNKPFKTKSVYDRHMKKKKTCMSRERTIELVNLKDQYDKFQQLFDISDLGHQNTTNNNTTNNTNIVTAGRDANINNNTTNNNITINVTFGKEVIDYLEQKQKEAIDLCFLRNYRAVKAFHKAVHFNPEHPENHTIAKTDKNRDVFLVKLKDGTFRLHGYDDIKPVRYQFYKNVAGHQFFLPEYLFTQHQSESTARDEIYYRDIFSKAIYELSMEHPEVSKILKKTARGIPYLVQNDAVQKFTEEARKIAEDNKFE